MRIAQVAPLFESVPPQLYGGTERVVAYLTDELVRQGHDVTLFASGDSRTNARMVSLRERSLRLDQANDLALLWHLLLVEEVFLRRASFDVVHFHLDLLHLAAWKREPLCSLTTLHGRLDLPVLKELMPHFAGAPMISISDDQRAPLPDLRWLGTVHHGLPTDLLQLQPGTGRYLAFLGRICPEKGIEAAMAIAKRVAMPLKIAAKIDQADRAYYEQRIRPLLADPLFEYVGEISEGQKGDFLGGAAALLFPIQWPEPFGMVMIEAMACGTPTIAFPCGAVPEVMIDGVTGFVVADVDAAVAAIAALPTVNRQRCRAVFEERFSARRMANDYVRLYEQLIDERKKPRRQEALSWTRT